MKKLFILLTKISFLNLLFILIFLGLSPDGYCFLKGDINNDDKIDLLETIHSLQVVSGSRVAISSKVINVPAEIPTIHEAIDAASEGDTINIAAGTYNETLFISKNRITLQGAGIESTIIDGQGEDVITIDSAQKVIITGVIVQNGNDGIIGKRGSAFEISNTTVQDCADEGIQVDENSTAQLKNCTVKNSGGHGIGVFQSNVFLNGNIVCNDNVGHGIGIFNSSNAVIIGATLTTNNNSRGIQVYNSSSLRIFNSTLTTNNNSRGIQVYNSSSLSSDDSTITFENNTRWGLHLGGTSSVYTAPGTTMTIRNSDRGFQLHGSSYAEITGSLLVENSGNIGILVTLNSGIEIGDPAEVTVRSSTGDGVGISIVDGSSFNVQGGSLIVENNMGDGIKASRSSRFRTGTSSSAQIRNNGGSGVRAYDGSAVNCSNSMITGNTGGDVVLSFGSRASLYGGTIGTISCDGTVLSRGDHVCPP